MSDCLDPIVEDEDGAADVVGVGVAVDEVRDGQGGHVANGIEQLGADGGRVVDNDDAFGGDEEEGLVASVGDHVGTLPEGFRIVPGGANHRSCRGGWDW